MVFEDFEHAVGLWCPGQQDAGRAHGQGKIEAVSQSIGEKKLGHTEATVLVGDFQYRLGISFGTHHHVMLQVNASLGLSRAAGRVKPESGIVLAGQLRL